METVTSEKKARKPHKKHVFKKERCSSKVRASIETRFGDKITLLGTHAFEWQIAIESNGTIKITSFPNRKEATKEFNKYKKVK